MTGMGRGAADPAVVAAFHRALLHGGLVVAGLALVVLVAWRLIRRSLAVGPGGSGPGGSGPAEPSGRRLVRVSFGLLWILDGVLQAQPAMPTGLVPQVIRPAAAGSPAWVGAVSGWGAHLWSHHQVTAAASAVWIQAGIGLLVLVAPPGTQSRLAGGAGAAWGLVVWVFGEAFGGVLAPGQSWMFGTPGAAALYVLAGVALAGPGRWWAGPAGVRALGIFYLGMALLQAWPGRGSWSGAAAAMSSQMAAVPQPRWLESAVSSFASFDAAHAGAVNLFVVAALAAVGAGLVVGRPGRLLWAAVAGAAVIGLADWVLVQDLGVLGGTGTDPNSMIPLLALVGAAAVNASRPLPDPAPLPGWPDPAFRLRTVGAAAAAGVALVGAAPMAVIAAGG